VRELGAARYAGARIEPSLEYFRVSRQPVELFRCTIRGRGFRHERGGRTMGYSSIGYLAPQRALCGDRPAGDAGARVQVHVKALAQGGIEVILAVVYNQPPRGPARADAVVQAVDNHSYDRLMPTSRGTT